MPPKKTLGRKAVTFKFRIPIGMHAWLVEKAGQNGVPLAVYLRRLIREAMARES